MEPIRSPSPTSPRRIDFDQAASTPLRPEVRAAMVAALDEFPGNPSSLHFEGRRARAALEAARVELRGALRAEDGFRLAFCAGGAEADNAAILGPLLARLADGAAPGDLHVAASAVEHSAVHGALETAASWGVTHSLVAVDRDGLVDPDEVRRALRPQTVLVSVMAVNNEVGARQPIEAIGRLLRERGISFHCDAVQRFGKLPLALAELPVDIATLSAHKLGGPKGCGALLVREGVPMQGLLRGGAQEEGLRGGTESLAQAVGFARAGALAAAEHGAEEPRLRRLSARLRSGLASRLEGLTWNGPESASDAAPHILNVSFARVEGESLLLRLDELGLAVSTGSACNAGAKRPSRVLAAMGRSAAEIRGSIRFSLGRVSTVEDVDAALERIVDAVGALRRLAP